MLLLVQQATEPPVACWAVCSRLRRILDCERLRCSRDRRPKPMIVWVRVFESPRPSERALQGPPAHRVLRA
jgi:hypothetical protein